MASKCWYAFNWLLILEFDLVFPLKKVRRPSNFSDFYAYSFRYCLTGIYVHKLLKLKFGDLSSSFQWLAVFYDLAEEKQKSVDIESVCLLLDLVLGSQFRPQVDALSQYLKVRISYLVFHVSMILMFKDKKLYTFGALCNTSVLF